LPLTERSNHGILARRYGYSASSEECREPQ
jgi:hypothetical protein